MTSSPEHTTRRSVLAAFGAAGALGLTAPAAAIITTPAADRWAWDRAFADYEKAKAKYDQAEVRCRPIFDSYVQAIKEVPHVTLQPDPVSGMRAPIGTDDRREVCEARRMVRELAEGRRKHDPYPDLMAREKLYRELAAAADARDTKIQQIDDRLGHTQADEYYEDACSRYVDAGSKLLDIPAPDAPALLWKMEYCWLGDEESSWSAECVSSILADARRLLSVGRA